MMRIAAAGFLPALASACAVMAISAGAPTSASAQATITIVNADGTGEGFNDPTPVAPLPGNPATTRGEQRLNVFRAAADRWEDIVASGVEIQVSAQFDPLACTATAGTLGSAGPTSVFRDFSGAPVANTWYPAALANSLAGSDLDPGSADIDATFNSRLDDDPNCLSNFDWWYGIGAPAPANTISFFDTVLHEIGHGLGFLTFVDITSGQKFLGRNDPYMMLLEDRSSGEGWPAMTNAERAASAIDTGDLHWTGNEVAGCAGQRLTEGAAPDGHVRMYAPNPLRTGSSVSHWDTVLAPDELMEPFATPTSVDDLTRRLFADIGWAVAASECAAEPEPEPEPEPVTTASNTGTVRLYRLNSQELQRGACVQMNPGLPGTGWACVRADGHLSREISDLLLQAYTAQYTCTLAWNGTDQAGHLLVSLVECR